MIGRLPSCREDESTRLRIGKRLSSASPTSACRPGSSRACCQRARASGGRCSSPRPVGGCLSHPAHVPHKTSRVRRPPSCFQRSTQPPRRPLVLHRLTDSASSRPSDGPLDRPARMRLARRSTRQVVDSAASRGRGRGSAALCIRLAEALRARARRPRRARGGSRGGRAARSQRARGLWTRSALRRSAGAGTGLRSWRRSKTLLDVFHP